MTQYYDLLLGLIPLALGGITTVLATVGVSLTLAVPIAASVAVALIGHGMFVRAPGASATPQPTSQTVNATPDSQINSAD
ncbi:hypothetical protein [Halococcus thailandensis]|uniref:Uncharacterized protein n=1 Tax=Halococcus thailandensis JCM 13552 TaxID=1227457 RepID=M0N4E2_9EURY|nr:hypothetical protein [Halococcus thailandensis]EMA51530.1 hypothetical protein C451_14735 [Halococcus thailandensis JCM 13552]